MWIFNPGHQYKEVQEGKMLSPKFERIKVHKSNRKRYLKESNIMLSDKQKEFDTNDGKCKKLLTISTFLLAAQVVIWGQESICLFVEVTTSSDDLSYFLLVWNVVTILQHFLFCKRQGIQECLHRRFSITIFSAVRT